MSQAVRSIQKVRGSGTPEESGTMEIKNVQRTEWLLKSQIVLRQVGEREFPGDPVVRTLSFHCLGSKFNI